MLEPKQLCNFSLISVCKDGVSRESDDLSDSAELNYDGGEFLQQEELSPGIHIWQ